MIIRRHPPFVSDLVVYWYLHCSLIELMVPTEVPWVPGSILPSGLLVCALFSVGPDGHYLSIWG